jgi:hypothetical protein
MLRMHFVVSVKNEKKLAIVGKKVREIERFRIYHVIAGEHFHQPCQPRRLGDEQIPNA